MKTTVVLLLTIAFGIGSCHQSSAPANTSIDTGNQPVPLVTETKPSDSLHNMDTSIMVVDSMSHITFNGSSLEKGSNSVYHTVYNSWLQSYQATGYLPLAFKLIQQGTVTMGVRGDIGDAVVKAQADMKDYVAKDKYHSGFEQLSPARKDSLQQLHPILFKRPF